MRTRRVLRWSGIGAGIAAATAFVASAVVILARLRGRGGSPPPADGWRRVA